MRIALIIMTIAMLGGTAYWVTRDSDRSPAARDTKRSSDDSTSDTTEASTSTTSNAERPTLPTLPTARPSLRATSGTEGDADNSTRANRRKRMLERFDTNGDGEISAEERAARRQGRLDRRNDRLLEAFDSNGDGELDDDELAVREAARQQRIAERAARILESSDTNEDGKLSRTEIEEGNPRLQRMLSNFDEVDTDGDSFISADEMAAADAVRRRRRLGVDRNLGSR